MAFERAVEILASAETIYLVSKRRSYPIGSYMAYAFGKLGIRHRTEIAAALAARQIQGVDAPNTGDSPVSAESIAP